MNPSFFLPLMLASALGFASCSRESAKGVEAPNVLCPVHGTRMGMKVGYCAKSKLMGGAQTPTTPCEVGHFLMSENEPNHPKDGRTWLWSCFSGFEEFAYPDWVPGSSDAPYEAFSQKTCILHNALLTPVAGRGEGIFPGHDHPTRVASRKAFPNIGILGCSQIEIPVEGARARWFASCPECEDAYRNWWQDRGCEY